MYSALVVVYTAYCALQIVRFTLHYITMHGHGTVNLSLMQINLNFELATLSTGKREVFVTVTTYSISTLLHAQILP